MQIKTALDKNSFVFEGFNSSFFLLQSAMKLLGNLNYNLQRISDELNISTTQLCKYLDSYVTIPSRPLPGSLGIDEIPNKYLSKRNSSYLCILSTMSAGTFMTSLIQETKNTCRCIFQAFQGMKDAR